MPVFDGELIAYTAIKAHWLDIAGKEPYSTDTVDVFQEEPFTQVLNFIIKVN